MNFKIKVCNVFGALNINRYQLKIVCTQHKLRQYVSTFCGEIGMPARFQSIWNMELLQMEEIYI